MQDIERLLGRSGVLGGRVASIEPLPGGLTNTSYRVRAEDGAEYVCRIAGPRSEEVGIDRDQEDFNARVAATAGLGPEVVESDPELGLFVSRFLAGRSLRLPESRDDSMIVRVASTVRQLHGAPPFRGSFDLRRIREHYRSIVVSAGYPLPDGYDNAQSEVALLESLLAKDPEPLVSCHNDLVPDNFIDDDERLWLIDFEFSSMNEPSFDLGNLANEWQLDEHHTQLLAATYWGTADPSKLARVNAWRFLARYTWVLWAAIQGAPVGPPLAAHQLSRLVSELSSS